jgi:hypothetical protein
MTFAPTGATACKKCGSFAYGHGAHICLPTAEKKALENLVRDHKIQAGIGLAVAMGVWHWSGLRKIEENVIWQVGDIIEVLKDKSKILISDQDNVLCCAGELYVSPGGKKSKLLRVVSRVAYIGAVVILAANAIDVQRQLRESL